MLKRHIAPDITSKDTPIPIISNAALKYCVECSTNPVEPKTMPPSVHATPPNAKTPITNGNDGRVNHCRKHPRLLGIIESTVPPFL